MNPNEISPIVVHKFVCNECEYKCCKLSDYNKHILTNKHKKLLNPTNKIAEKKLYTCKCGKIYKHSSTFSCHKKTCDVYNKVNDAEVMIINEADIKDLKELITKFLHENHNLKKENQEFKNLLIDQQKQIIDLIELDGAKNKLVKQFSSGMKQRLKLGLAILSDTPLLLLDEPLSNLDKKSITWYQELVVNHCKKRTVIVCSNAIDDEFNFCNAELNVMDYKK